MEPVIADETVYTPVLNGISWFPFLDAEELAELRRGGDAYVANLPTQ